MDKQPATYKDACLSAVILALANMGDAFLYAYLPANYQHIGISSFWVGVLLSVNRFTRLFLNGRAAWILSNKGIKIAIITAIILASTTTISYGFHLALPIWISARILWGISFSTLRLGNALYAMEHKRKGTALGFSRALIEIGPVIALLAGPFLLQHTGQLIIFLTFGMITMASIFLVLPLSNLKTENVSKKDLLLSYPTSYNVLVLVNAFITEGILVVLLGRLILDQLTPIDPLFLIGILLGYRRVALVLLSPLSGWLADKWGFQKIFMYTIILSAAGILLTLLGAAVIGIVATFTFSAMNSSTAIGGAINSKYSLIKNVSDNATWRDIGTATGTFIGALLLSFSDLRWIPLFLVILYGLGLFYHRLKSENTY